MSSQIQGFRMQGNVASIDFNAECTQFVAGGKESIKIVELRIGDDYWFHQKKFIGKHKGAPITKTCVSELAWNKSGRNLIAMGTTSGYVLVYDVEDSYKKTLQVKGHDGNIRNVLWFPGSSYDFLSASSENTLIRWDARNSTSQVARFVYSEHTKIRDLKFNPFDENVLAVQSSTKLELFDLRNLQEPYLVEPVGQGELQGNVVEWDPAHKDRVALAVSKQVKIFSIAGDSLRPEEDLAHYSLIKSLRWMRHKSNQIGITGENPERNLCFYDLEDRNRIARIYGGYNRAIDCWLMNSDESLVLTVYKCKDKDKNGGNKANNAGLIVAQRVENCLDPNQARFNYPLTCDNNSGLAFPIIEHLEDKEYPKDKDSKVRHMASVSLRLSEENFFQSIREELVYLHKNYQIEGNEGDIAVHNAQVAERVGKHKCSDLWHDLFSLCLPVDSKKHTVESLFEAKIKPEFTLSDCRIIMHEQSVIQKAARKINPVDILQAIVDENQLQTAVLAAICLLHRSPGLLPQSFLQGILSPYIELLRSLDLYFIAAETVRLTKMQRFQKATTQGTNFSISCGWCEESITKGKCKCDLICVLCKGPLNKRVVMWCKYCGHGGHAAEYKKYFQQQDARCPHGCGHRCFGPDTL